MNISSSLFDGAPLPIKIDDIDAAWLSRALSAKWPGVEVGAVTRLQTFDGSSMVVRLQIDTNMPEVPSTICLKGGFNPISRFAVYALLTEARFYAWAAQQPDMMIPDCFFAATDEKVGQGILILEDLAPAGTHFFNPVDGLTVADVTSLLAFLADLHARTWGSPVFVRKDLKTQGGALKKDGILQGLFSRGNWDWAMSQKRSSALTGRIRDRDVVWNAFMHSARLNSSTCGSCLLHGDPHPGNLFKRSNGDIGLYDWQLCMTGPWVQDVTYLMTAGLSVADRRNHERDLLTFYLEQLAAKGGPAPSFDEAFEIYRRTAIQPMGWVVTPALCQSEASIEAVSNRVAHAVQDLDTLAAFDESILEKRQPNIPEMI